jgi:hypothetical protein
MVDVSMGDSNHIDVVKRRFGSTHQRNDTIRRQIVPRRLTGREQGIDENFAFAALYEKTAVVDIGNVHG